MWSGRLRALQALMLTMTRRLDEAAEVADRALADGERIADPFATGYVLHALSHVSFVERDLAAALDRIDRALAVIGRQRPDNRPAADAARQPGRRARAA